MLLWICWESPRWEKSFFATIPSQVSQLWLKEPYKRLGICLRLMRTARPTALHNHLPSGELSATMPLPLTKLITAALPFLDVWPTCQQNHSIITSRRWTDQLLCRWLCSAVGLAVLISLRQIPSQYCSEEWLFSSWAFIHFFKSKRYKVQKIVLVRK